MAPDTEHAPAVLVESMEKLTGSPEVAVAATLYVPPTVGDAGGVEVNEIVCDCCVPVPAWRIDVLSAPSVSVGSVSEIVSTSCPCGRLPTWAAAWYTTLV